MGHWWKDVMNQQPPDSSANPQAVVTFPGDPTAVPKRWWNGWRLRHDWRTIEIMSDRRKWGYDLYFSGGGVTMCYRDVLKAQFVMVREGREPVTFWVKDRMGEVLPVADGGFIYPAKVGSRRSSPPELLDKLRLPDLAGEVAWV